jgi:putative DNA primase/helicase
MNPTEQFRDAIRAAGIEPPETIEADGRIHRFATNGKRDDTAGWYVLHTDGVAAGAFGCWRNGIDETWNAGTELSAADREKHRRTLEMIKRAREEENERRRAEAAQTALRIWEQATAVGDHPYLKRKNVKPHGLRVRDGLLVIPVLDVETCDLISLQFISAEGEKKLLPGARVGRGYYQIGEATNVILVCEGFATGASLYEATNHMVAVAFSANNLTSVAKALRSRYREEIFVLCADNDANTDGNPGLTSATEAAREIGALLAVPESGDFNDLQQRHGLSGVREIIERLLAERPDDVLKIRSRQDLERDEQEEFMRLARLSVREYEAEREPAAKRLEIRVSVLDKEVNTARRRLKSAELAGTAIAFEDPQVWSEPVDGAALLEEIAAAIRRHVVVPQHADTAIALWVVLTYLGDVIATAPILSIVSPTHRCGKTTLLGLLNRLAERALPSSNISSATLFRVIEQYKPTLIVDEGDSFLNTREELRGLLDSGHTRDAAFVFRCVGDDQEVRRFSTWGLKTLAAIGTLPVTIIDRSLVIDLQRKRPDERVTKLRDADPALFKRLASQLAPWKKDNAEAVGKARPAIPAELGDRAGDNWDPLLAVADLAAAEWPEKARRAALALSGAAPDGDTFKVELLHDIRQIFREKDVDRISTDELLDRLNADLERPWCEFNRGKPMTPRGLARMLGHFHIVPTTVRFNDKPSAKGYHLDGFLEPFTRYLPGKPPSNPLHGYNLAPERLVTDSQSVTEGGVLRIEKPPNASTGAACNGVTDQNPLFGEKREDTEPEADL